MKTRLKKNVCDLLHEICSLTIFFLKSDRYDVQKSAKLGCGSMFLGVMKKFFAKKRQRDVGVTALIHIDMPKIALEVHHPLEQGLKHLNPPPGLHGRGTSKYTIH